MSPLERLLKEAHRRGLWQVLVVFAGGGWGVLGVIDTLIGYGYLPAWVFGGGLLALLLGLPVVSATSWIQGGRRARPPATAGDPEDEALLARAEAAQGPLSSERGAETGFEAEDIFTWRRALTGGVLAFALLGVLAAGYMFMRATGLGTPGTLVAQGVLDQGAEIVLADFESSAGAVAPGDLITESLRIDLAQSDAIRLTPEREVEAVLTRMRRDASEPVTEDVALEVAERAGAAAVIAGEIGGVGSGFLINARVVSVATGEPLAQFRVSADGEDELLDAIDELSRSMRDKIGESLRSIASTESLASVSTSSLEALRKYSAASNGSRRGLISYDVAQQLFVEAVALDSTFSAAHRALAISINNTGGDRELMNNSIRAAYRHRSRLPERERLGVEASYHRFAGDRDEAARSYRALLAVDPGDAVATTNLTDILIYDGEYEEAIALSRASPEWEEVAWGYNYMVSLVALGQLEAALAVQDTLAATLVEDPFTPMIRSMLNSAAERPDVALEILRAAPPSPDPVARAYEAYATAQASFLSGALGAATEQLDGAVVLFGDVSGPSTQIGFGLARPWVSAVVFGDPGRARAEAEELKRLVDWEGLSPYNRNYPAFALLYAIAGLDDEARDMLDRFDEEVAAVADPRTRGRASTARAILAVRSGEDDALDRFDRGLDAIGCQRCGDLLFGLVHESIADGASAIDRYERYVDEPFFPVDDLLTHLFSANVNERLGRLYEASGDPEQAVEHYLRFVEMWGGADADLQPRVEAARARVEALRRAP